VTNVRLVLEYDGSDFHGWQAQPPASGQRTVQAEVERAIATVTGETPKVVAAGRTDAGAHSLGQTVNFELGHEFQPELLRRSLNGVLPRDIAVLSAGPCPAVVPCPLLGTPPSLPVPGREPRRPRRRPSRPRLARPLDVGPRLDAHRRP